MDARQAVHTLEVIRTLMERTCQYQLLTARAGLVAGSLAGMGSLLFLVLDANDPWHFGSVWAFVFLGSLSTAAAGTILRGHERGEPIWSRQARAVVFALLPGLFAAAVLSVFFFARGQHLWLPGVWMLCYGQGALATSTYAPSPIRWLGMLALALAGVTLFLGPAWSVPMMGIVFGLGHIILGIVLLRMENQQVQLRLHRDVA